MGEAVTKRKRGEGKRRKRKLGEKRGNETGKACIAT